MVFLLFLAGCLLPAIGHYGFADPEPTEAELLSRPVLLPLVQIQRVRQLLAREPQRTELWYAYVAAHFRLEKAERKDETFRNELRSWPDQGNPTIRDNIRYALGLWHAQREEYPQALKQYREVANPDHPFLNNSFGFLRLDRQRRNREEGGARAVELAELASAESFFRRELVVGGNRMGAWTNLAQTWYLAGSFTAILTLAQDPKAREAVPAFLLRVAGWHERDFGWYWFGALAAPLRGVGPLHFFSALITLLFWLGFLRRVDLFEPEPLWALLTTVLLGMASMLFLPPAHDLLVETLGFPQGERSFGSHWLHLLVVVGLLEESVKIVPLLLMMRFSRQVDESVDFLIYAMASALGFAFLENLTYSAFLGPQVVFPRTFTAVVTHLTLSGLAGYGFFLAQGKRPAERWRPIATWFGLAVVLHAAYDFVLLEKRIRFLLPLTSLAALILLYRILRLILTNALNHSEFYSETAAPRLAGVFRYLVFGLLWLFIWNYLSAAWWLGPSLAETEAVRSGLPVFLFPWLFGTYVLRRRQWETLLPARPNVEPAATA